jgi:hypothetical protein
VNEDDGALQILLIIDFIFDWARDVYRPTIISQLRTLSGHQEDTLSALADNDICSLAGDQWTEQIEKWRGSIQYPVQTNTEDDCNIEEWGLLDSKVGPGLGVFRPAWIIESVFQCLYVTKHNVKDLLNSIPKGRTPNSLATKAESSLSQNHVLISEDVLSTMEEIWTHKARRQETHGISEGEKLFATIIYHTEISSTWEPRRYISCAVFDREALDELRSFTKRKGRRAALLNAKEFSRENAVNLLYGLQRLNIEASLAAAIACRRQHLREIAGTPSSKQCPTFEFVDTHSVDTFQPVVLAECELISPIYEWRKIASSPKEPADSYLRFSRHSNTLEDTLATPTVSSYFLDSAPSKNEKYILVHRNRGDRRWISNCLCLYQIKPTEGPPSKKELAKALWRACKDDIVHSLGGYNNWKAQQKLKPVTPGEPQKAWNIAEKWLEELQPLLPETDNIEASGPAIRPEDTLVGGDRHSSNPASPKTSSSSFQALPAISTSSDAVNQTNIALPDSAVSETPSSGLEEDDDAELTATLHKSVLTYFAEKGAENPHNASEEPMVQGIQKTQPEQNPHTEPKHVLTAANTDAQAKVDEQDQASRTLPSPSSSPSWRSGAPSPVDSEVTTPPLSVAAPYTSPYLLNAWPGSSKRPLELEDDENPAQVHEKKARSHLT